MPKPPQRKTEWKDQYTLLCESCGYILEGLDHSLPCPECGKPITESLPHERVGSPWQHKRSIMTMIKTWFHVLVRPKAFFKDLNINPSDARSLMLRANLLAAIIPFIFIVIMIVITILDGAFFISSIFSVLLCLTISLIYWGVALAYTALAVPRVRYIAKHRRYRITGPAIWSAAGHASMGLTLAPIFINTAFVIGFSVFNFDSWATQYTAPIGVILNFLYLFSLPIAVATFEILLAIGTRQLRNRNTHQIPIDAEQSDA